MRSHDPSARMRHNGDRVARATTATSTDDRRRPRRERRPRRLDARSTDDRDDATDVHDDARVGFTNLFDSGRSRAVPTRAMGVVARRDGVGV